MGESHWRLTRLAFVSMAQYSDASMIVSTRARPWWLSRSSGLRIVSGSLTRRRANSALARPRTSASAEASDENLKLIFAQRLHSDRPRRPPPPVLAPFQHAP